MVGRKAVDDVVGAGVLLAVTVEVAMIGLYLVVRADDGLVVRPNAFHFCRLADRYPAVRHKANHTSKP